MTLFRKAERSKAKLRLGLVGPAGSGKTHSALLIASGIGGKIAVADSENGSANKEVGKKDIPPFDVMVLSSPFTPTKYIEAIKAAEAEGFDVIILDSLSAAWAGSGGLLEKVDAVTKASTSKNSYMAWREVTPLHNKLVDSILQSKCHVIVTMRSKVEYVVEKDEKTGKNVPKKVGLAPVQREGMDYELDLVFDVDQATHYAMASKDRTSLFDGEPHKPSKETGERLAAWLAEGVEPPKPVILCANCLKKGLEVPYAEEVDGSAYCAACATKYREINK